MTNALTTLPLINDVSPLIREMYDDLMIAGGYALWAAGGASFYSDIDCYARNWGAYYKWYARMSAMGEKIGQSPFSCTFYIQGDYFQLIQPAQVSELDLILTSDLSPSACCLTWDADHFIVVALYPDDIAQRVCRVLTHHEWTPYRLEVYQRKGYEIQ